MPNNDHLFVRQAPAALRRHAAADFADNTPIDATAFFDRYGKQVGGINAGVVILEPSAKDYQYMLEDIQRDTRGMRDSSKMPEQDWLSRFYCGQWYNLGVEYNYQPHQIAYTDRAGLEDCFRLKLPLEQVRIVHLSAIPKPRDLVVNSQYGGDRRDQSKPYQGVFIWACVQCRRPSVAARRRIAARVGFGRGDAKRKPQQHQTQMPGAHITNIMSRKMW